MSYDPRAIKYLCERYPWLALSMPFVVTHRKAVDVIRPHQLPNSSLPLGMVVPLGESGDRKRGKNTTTLHSLMQSVHPTMGSGALSAIQAAGATGVQTSISPIQGIHTLGVQGMHHSHVQQQVGGVDVGHLSAMSQGHGHGHDQSMDMPWSVPNMSDSLRLVSGLLASGEGQHPHPHQHAHPHTQLHAHFDGPSSMDEVPSDVHDEHHEGIVDVTGKDSKVPEVTSDARV
jgi:hypothetical protein